MLGRQASLRQLLGERPYEDFRVSKTPHVNNEAVISKALTDWIKENVAEAVLTYNLTLEKYRGFKEVHFNLLSNHIYWEGTSARDTGHRLVREHERRSRIACKETLPFIGSKKTNCECGFLTPPRFAGGHADVDILGRASNEKRAAKPNQGIT